MRRERRSLPPNECATFKEAARKGKPKRKLTGEDRSMLYLLAANSGFRCSELASLTPQSFDLAGDSPTVTVDAAYSRRRRQDAQPLPRDAATVLAQWLRGKAAAATALAGQLGQSRRQNGASARLRIAPRVKGGRTTQSS